MTPTNPHAFWSRRGVANYLLWPLSGLWGLAQRLHRFHRRLIPPKPLPDGVRTVCVGNILVGGSGKTPFTIFLAQWLQQRGEPVAVALRGYRGAWERCGGIVSDTEGLRPGAHLAGDEALLLAESLPGIPVAVGRNRRTSIERLRRIMPSLRWVVLDDAFQHLRLPHDVSFVLFSASRGLGNGILLPSGPLREPLAVARVADAAVLVGDGDAGFLASTGLPVLRGHFQPGELVTMTGEPVSIDELRRQKLALLSGIGNPASFEQTVRGLGLEFAAHYAYPDHHDYAPELDSLCARLRRDGIERLLTTAKDAARLRALPALDLPLVALPITFVPEQTALLERIFSP
ncbi:MAG: tetraacyldisaccharide 4'-kinase [Candidatus Cloacimonetes bacterium]|nr:tetraacyldisaccharide 4'-kinase [Candidatus Cloacimonadota bacterium]